MNKIYKVMYSKVKQCAVVVSEIAKSHGHNGESSGVRKHAALTAAVLIALGSLSFTVVPIAPVAADFYRNDYVGTNYTKDNGKSYAASETKNYHGNGAKGVGSNTLGLNAIAGKNTVTIGDRDASLAQESVYIGSKYDANNQIHPSSGKSVVSVGYGSDAAGTGSIAIGSGASADAFDNAGTGANPDSDSHSIAIGNNAVAKQNNIAIGAGSEATAAASKDKAYLSGQDAVSSYVSVGKSDALRRISNVADGAADSDVATVGQLKKLSDRAGVYNEGWGIKIGDYTTKDANGQETTVKNAISIDRNLGSNEITSKSNNTFEAAGENSLILGGAGTDDFVAINGKHREKDYGSYGKDSVLVGGENNKTTKDGTYAVISGGGQNIASGKHSFIGGGWWNTATGATSTVVGGQANTASGNQSTVVGGQDSRAIGDESTILGGFQHTAVGENSTISGGAGAYTLGQYSSVSGGQGNIAIGMTSSADGGWLNFAYGDWSQASGGYSNYVLGNASNSLGGRDSVIQGNLSVGIAGGSTGQGAGYALAAGYQSVVTAEGVHREKSSDSIVDSYLEAGNDTGGNEGYKYTDVATALGYQATANETNTVSFGHDKGDVSGYTVNWDIKYDTDDQGNIKFNEDGMPLVESIKANGITTNHYDSAKYNCLVKVADGINNHDVVVMEQLRNADNVGKNAKNNVVVYKENKDGTLQVDENGEAIIDVDASKAATEKATEQAIKDSEDAWGSAIGTGKVEANNSQLVTGDTVYNAIQNQAEWKLTTNDESADKAAAIKPGTTVNFSAEKNGKDHSNVTISHNVSNVTIGLDKDIVLGDTSHSSGGSLNVYTDSSDGNNLSNHVSINGSTISVNYPKSNGDKKATTDTRGVILGVGEEDSKPDGYIAFNNVEGGYTYLHASTDASDDKKGRLEYVGSDGNKKYIANLDDVSTAVNNAKTKYYSVTKGFKLGDYRTNENNDGATDAALAGMAAGYETGTTGIASTVVGSYSGVMNTGTSSGIFGHDVRGAAAVSVGTVNVNNNSTSKTYSGVANSIVGQANMTTNSNAAIIYGAGNTVTDSYRPIDEKKAVAILTSISDQTKLREALQAAVKDSGGQVMVMGGGNTVDKAYMSQVVGVGNTVKGNQVENDKGEWGTDTSNTAIKYDPEKSSQYNYVDGFNNEVINGKHDYVIGANNKLSGDSYDDKAAKKYSNESNIVFGDNHTLTNTKNAVIIGSSDTQMILDKGDNATAIGHNASAQRDALAVGVNTEAGGNAVALGTSTIAHNNSIAIGTKATAVSSQNLAIGWEAHIGNIKTDNEKIKNAVALGSDSQVKVNDLLESDNNRGVLSIGDKDKERRIIHVRAGVNDTDAVNVSQLKSAQSDLTGKGLKFAANSGNEYTAKLGTTVKVLGTAKKEGHEYTADNLTTEIDKDGNITILMDKNVSAEKIAVNGKDGENGKPGTAGSIGISGQDGKAGVGIDGKDGISIKGQNGKDGVTIKGIDGVDGVDGAEGHIGLNGKDGMTDIFTTAGTPGLDGKDGETMTRIVYKDPKGTEHEAATLDDGLKFKGDDGKEVAKKLNNTLDIIGGAKGDLTEGNIGVNSTDKGQLKVQLAKDLKGITSISNQKTEGGKTTGAKVTLGADGSVDVNGGKITHVGSGADASGNYTTTTNAANIGDVQKIVKDAVDSAADTTNKALAGKANVDASNIGANLKGEDGKAASAEAQKANAEKWGSAIGTGKIEKDNGQLVTGKTVYEYNKPIAEDGKKLNYVSEDKTTGQNLGALDAQVKNNADAIKKNSESIQNITNNVKNLSDNAVQYDKDSNKTKVTLAGTEGTTITNVKDGALSEKSSDAVNGKQLYNEQKAREEADKAITEKVINNTNEITKIKNGDFTDASKTAIHNIAKDAVKVVNGTNTTVTTVDGTNTTPTTYAVNVEGNGKVDSGDKGLISGGTLYNEVRPTEDGNYVKKDKTTGQNLSALDSGLKATSDLIHTNTQQIYRDMNNAYGRLNNNINKAAAGSNALAALHPLDYDPDDKADFAVGYGHYRNANAAAVGAFYHPNENTMVNVGVSLGNGDPGFNAGVSFKVGRGGAGREAMSKTEMAKVINSQSKEIDALKKDNADKDKRIDALEQKMAEILAKLDKNGK